MEYEKIRQLIEDMGNSKLTSLDLELADGTKISMKKEQKQETIVVNQSQENYVNSAVATISKETDKREEEKIVKSPMVGTFYTKPSPTSEPYVEKGKEIKKGDTLCIVEAMKLMNEIESEYTGKIIEILVKDGEAVEYGTELFKIAVSEA